MSGSEMNKVENLIYNASQFSNSRETVMQFKMRQNQLLPEEYWKKLLEIKKTAVKNSEHSISKVSWCFETIGHIHDEYIRSYNQLKEGDFYDSWCSLEKCETQISFLDDHFHDEKDEFGIDYIRNYVEKLQSLFPYKTFISPGFTGKRRCSICNEMITPRNCCEHENGEIYDGEMCSKIVTDMNILEVSIVDNPVQKYSVINAEKHNHELLKYLIKKFSSPWELWDYKISKKLVSKYSKIGRNELCPCESGLKFKKCCLNEKKEIDHYTFMLNKN